jgi:thiazole synthase ThiGH ThiG subunit
VAELARAGLTPDWMPGAAPRCVPVDIKRNRHGDRAVSMVVGTERVLIKGKWRSVEVRACPVTFRPDSRQIEGARRAYQEWWQALEWILDGLLAGGILREVEVIAAMPKVQPWLARKRTAV